MPEQACRDRPPGPPRLAELQQRLGIRACRESLGLADRGRERDVADRPHVRSSEDHQQIDRGRPTADPRDGLERGPDPVVVELFEDVEVEGAVEDRGGKRAPVARLLPAEADRQQLAVRQTEERGGRERIRGGEESIVGRPG